MPQQRGDEASIDGLGESDSMITEKDNVFYCDCGFSFQRGRSGAHDCADGLRNKLAESEARCAALAAENAGLKAANAEGCKWDGEQWVGISIETPTTEAILAEVRAQGADECVRKLVTSDDDDFSDAPNICAMVAHHLRKGGATEEGQSFLSDEDCQAFVKAFTKGATQ